MKKIIGLLVLVIAVFLPCAVSAHEVENVDAANQASPRGIYVSITGDIYAENGYVYGVAHNSFAIGFSKVYTVVILYSSNVYTENIDEMTHEAYNSINDLNLGQSLIASAEIKDNHYWRCVVKFKKDSSEWVYGETDTAYF